MKKLIAFIFVCVVFTHLKSQMYATPGSQWHYNNPKLSGSSYARITLGGTVTIASKVCTQLNYYSETLDYISHSTYTHSQIPYRYIYENNNVVYLYNQHTTIFDTLYNYNASIGSKWLLPANYTYTSTTPCNKTTVTVIDTGHTTIQGISLKWLKVNGDTILERIGFLNQYFFQYDNCTGMLDYFEGGGLRCFSDNQILNYNKTANACNYLYSYVSIKEVGINNAFKIYPNPTNSIVNVECFVVNNENYKIEITNIVGQKLKEEVLKFEKQSINLIDLQNGIYFLYVYGKDKLIGTTKIIKE
jgi:hypothetical protein